VKVVDFNWEIFGDLNVHTTNVYKYAETVKAHNCCGACVTKLQSQTPYSLHQVYTHSNCIGVLHYTVHSLQLAWGTFWLQSVASVHCYHCKADDAVQRVFLFTVAFNPYPLELGGKARPFFKFTVPWTISNALI